MATTTANKKKYKRVLLKLSGEALMKKEGFGIDSNKLKKYCAEIQKVVDRGIELAIVVGGGNIFRGLSSIESGFERTQGDYMGMLATMMNALALQSWLEKIEIPTRILSGIEIKAGAEPYIRRKAMRHLEKGRVVIFAAGTGNPFFTTDTAASLRAAEIQADVIMKGTRVDGVYTSDPEKDKTAKKYTELSYNEVYSKKLSVMDMTAFTLCQETKIPIVVFNINKEENFLKATMKDSSVGTIVH